MEFNCASHRMAVIAILTSPLILGGCLTNDPINAPAATVVAPVVGNSAPNISGAPPQSIKVSVNYNFTPVASDPDADVLTFSVTNKPSWANFDAASGRLFGVPTLGTEGSYDNIVISTSDGQLTSSLPAFGITVEPATVSNLPPQINGSAPASVVAGQDYSFTPTASDPDGDPLTFSILNQPAWAAFNPASGQLSGTPQDGDVGNYTGITVSVSDSDLTDSLQPFSVSVEQVSLGSVTLNWTPPTQNTDGSTLDDLAGYRIYYGVSENEYPNSVTLDNPGLSTFVVENLVPGTYFFVSTAMNAQGVESEYSNVAEKLVN